MITLNLLAQAEKIAPPEIYEGLNLTKPPLYHQLRTMKALHDHDVVVNMYNTGAGKTRASLMHLLNMKDEKEKNVLLIAPTNALIDQHVASAREFVAEHHLDYHVFAATAKDIQALGIDGLEHDLRSGEKLYRLIRNYTEFEACTTRRQPFIMVTNPDIFYYALFFRYGAHDQRNVFGEFIRRFRYIIIDEFHYYNNKQLANFLFAFALYQQWGFFSHADGKICLLSATPRDNVLRYLHELFGERLALLHPDNEPEESTYYPTEPALTPLEVQIIGSSLNEWLQANSMTLQDWLDTDHLDGAIISNSLARINSAYDLLKRRLSPERLGRITGPESAEHRASATACPLILATPTVDIGYNFDKLAKAEQRQNIDFVICEARFQDELVQRIGRAGRVLFKQQTNLPSYAVVLVSPEAEQQLADMDGQTLSRAEFAERLKDAAEVLPFKHQLDGYIRSYAVQEAFYPIYRISQISLEEDREMDELYKRLCQLFAPKWEHREQQWKAIYRKLDKRKDWLKVAKNSKAPPPETQQYVLDWINWIDEPSPDLKPNWYIVRDSVIQFVQAQVDLTEALFKFRDSFQGPVAIFYDPKRWFSSQPINQYDAFHLLANYHVSSPVSRQQLAKAANLPLEEIPEGEIYFQLQGQRETALQLELVLDSELEASSFNKQWTRLPVALRGMRVLLRGEDGAVPMAVEEALAKQAVIGMLVPSEDNHVIRSKFGGTELWARRLHVNFVDGSEAEYRFFAGYAAFEAHAQLLSYFIRRERARHDAIIC